MSLLARLAPHLPYVRRYARALTGDQSTGDNYVRVALEALAAGRPVVTRDLPVLREVFGSTARFASDVDGFAAEISAALADPGDPGPGRALALSLTWDSAARAHLAFYEKQLSTLQRGRVL